MRKLPWKRCKNAKKHEARIVYGTWFILFAFFVKHFVFCISSFVCDLSIEWFFDETSKEFFTWRQTKYKIQTNYE